MRSFHQPVVSRFALRCAMIEPLEPRRLFNAGQLDPTYGNHGIVQTADSSAYGYANDYNAPNIAAWGSKVVTASGLEAVDEHFQPIGPTRLAVYRTTAKGKPDLTF